MVISNIGTIVLSLYPEAVSGVRSLSSSAENVTATQVRLLSISNTLSRLISGPLADFVSPLTSHIPGDGLSRPQSYRISRVMLLSGTSLLLAGTFIYLELAIRTPDGLRILRYVLISLFVFAHYSVTYQYWYRCHLWCRIYNSVRQSFYFLPSYITYIPRPEPRPGIVSSIWGSCDFGRNFGMITYAPFIGTPLFSYLYAFVSAHNNVGGGVCTGVTCWSLTFWVGTSTSLLAFVTSIFLWRRWKELV